MLELYENSCNSITAGILFDFYFADRAALSLTKQEYSKDQSLASHVFSLYFPALLLAIEI